MQKKMDLALDKFGTIAQQLSENQVQIRISMAKLSESVEGTHKLSARQDLLETEIRKNSALVYKIVGIGMAGAALLPTLLQYIKFG